MSHATTLRRMLNGPGMITAPGTFECITARAVARAGFKAAYMTGAGTAATLGFPDFGLVTMSEMAANAGRIAVASNLPVIADADTGYGNELNAFRTVQEYERAGVAGLHMEDQVMPKRCGHLDDKEVVPLEDFVAKIRAACDARQNPDFVIIARTDARAVLGFEEALRRAEAALDAGADVAFVEAPQTMDEVREVPKRLNKPCLMNVVTGGKSPDLDLATAAELGYKIAIVPGVLTSQIVATCDSVLADLMADGRPPARAGAGSVADFFRLVGADDWQPLRTKYRDTDKPAAAE
jgi:2-methylisocitrate lyase-like PEP mutase family enzyme